MLGAITAATLLLESVGGIGLLPRARLPAMGSHESRSGVVCGTFAVDGAGRSVMGELVVTARRFSWPADLRIPAKGRHPDRPMLTAPPRQRHHDDRSHVPQERPNDAARPGQLSAGGGAIPLPGPADARALRRRRDRCPARGDRRPRPAARPGGEHPGSAPPCRPRARQTRRPRCRDLRQGAHARAGRDRRRGARRRPRTPVRTVVSSSAADPRSASARRSHSSTDFPSSRSPPPTPARR